MPPAAGSQRRGTAIAMLILGSLMSPKFPHRLDCEKRETRKETRSKKSASRCLRRSPGSHCLCVPWSAVSYIPLSSPPTTRVLSVSMKPLRGVPVSMRRGGLIVRWWNHSGGRMRWRRQIAEIAVAAQIRGDLEFEVGEVMEVKKEKEVMG